MSSTPGSKSEAESAVSSALANAAKLVLESEAARKSAAGMKAFRLNSGVKPRPDYYKAPASDVGDLSIGRVQIQHDDPQKWFEAKYPDIFEHYRLPHIDSDELVQAWRRTPMQFWQNQLNFAVWCATVGCGVSAEDHLSASNVFLKSFYRFHVYYQIRRILEELMVALPDEETWDAVNNTYDNNAYKKICREFGVIPHSSYWKVKGPNWGLGLVYFYRKEYKGFYGLGDEEYDSRNMSFTEESDGVRKIGYLRQIAFGIDTAWKNFILDKSDGLTGPGVARMNDSIRSYVWTILSAQVLTRSGILGTGAAEDARKHFLVLVENVIKSPVDIPSAILRYEEAMQHARSKAAFSFGEGLYLSPGDMLLRIGKIAGYNNNILIATSAHKLGWNDDLNEDTAPPDAENDTGEKGLVKPMGADSEAATNQHPAIAKPTPATTTAADKADHEAHEDEKTALIVGSIAIGLGLFWFLR